MAARGVKGARRADAQGWEWAGGGDRCKAMGGAKKWHLYCITLTVDNAR